MPYVLRDEDYKTLQTIIEHAHKMKGSMDVNERHALLVAIEFSLSQAVEFPDLSDDIITKAKIKRGGMLNVSGLFDSLLRVLTNEVGAVVMSKINGTPWFFADDMAPELCGMIPHFINASDDTPLAKQIDKQYSHGGGWRPLRGWRLNPKRWQLIYCPNDEPSEDPPLSPLGAAALRGEIIVIYPYAWVLVLNENLAAENQDAFVVARID